MKKLPAVAALSLLAATLATMTLPAQADTGHTLPVTSFSDLLVDQPHGHVFVAGGSLVIADLDGAVAGTVAGIAAARQMALTADGAQLVVTNDDGLTIVDPVTATVVRSIATGANSCPDAVAPSSGLMFFTYGDCEGGTPGLGAVDLADDSVTKGISTGSLVPASAQLKAFDASDLGARFGGTLAALATTGGPSPTVTVRSRPVDPTFADFAFIHAVGEVVTASPGVANHGLFGFTDAGMRAFTQAATGSTPTAVANRDDGMMALANGRRLQVWEEYSQYPAVVRNVLLPVGTTVPARGLEFGSSRLFAVTKEPDNSYLLRRIDDGLLVNFWLRNSRSPLVSYGGSMKLTARLDKGPTNRNVSIWAVPVGKPRYLLVAGRTVNGYLTVTASHLTRNTTFEATFDGDDFYAPQTVKSVPVLVKSKVTLSTSSTSMSGSYHKVAARPVHTLAGLVSPSHPGQCVGVIGEIKIGTRWETFQRISCLKTSSTSRFSLRMTGFEPGDKVRVRSAFRADKVNTWSSEVTYYILFT